MRSRTDYILGTDRRLFRNVFAWDPRNNSDHYMVLGCLRSSPLRENSEYFGRTKRLPLRLPTILTREDGIFAFLRRDFPKPKAWDARENAWILETT